MNEPMRPDEAARALDEIGRRQEQVVAQATIPDWFWWAIAALMVLLAVVVDDRRPVVVGAGTAVYVIGMMLAVGRVVLVGQRRARLRNELLGPLGVLAILGLVALVLAVSLPISFALKAAGSTHPATIGVLAGAVVMVVGGPVLRRYLHRVMMANRSGRAR